MKHTGSTLLRTLLERQGIRRIPGIPGGAILPLYDALHDSKKIRHILARHEQAAGFIAQGIARATGQPAVCLATSGPGATNLLTAIADAHLDSIPLVAITAQVSQNLLGTDAFQEVDTYGLTLPITKHNFLIRDAAELLEKIPLAFQLAQSGRPGPVAIDIPKSVLTETLSINNDKLPPPGRAHSPAPTPPEKIAELLQLISLAQRPLLLLGGGVIHANASQQARQLAKKLRAPAVTTLMGLGTLSHDDPHNIGMLGMHGTHATHRLLDETDLLIAIGTRFDDRATGKVAEFCPQAAIAHIDIDPAEFGKIKNPHLTIVGDAREILTKLLDKLPPPKRADNTWLRHARQLRDAHPLHAPPPDKSPLHPVNLIRQIAALLPDATVATDVGQHQMWTAQAWPLDRPRQLLTSGGLGTMGFGLPAAIGAAIATKRRTALITGDGSLLMNIQELATLAEHNLPVAIFVFNNGHLGLVRQQQQLFYKSRYSASKLHGDPDYAAIARGFGIRAHKINPNKNPLRQIAAALETADGPVLIDIPIDAAENVYPMVPPGAANRHAITPNHQH